MKRKCGPCWRQRGSATRHPLSSTTPRASCLTFFATEADGTRRSSRWPNPPRRDSNAPRARHTTTPWPRSPISPRPTRTLADWARRSRCSKRVRDTLIAKFGPDHPDTLITINNLATAYSAAGKYAEAIALYEHVRDAQITHLGPDHPDTLLTINNLASGYWRTKQLDKSVPLFEDVLKRKEARLGRQHHETQMTVANLGINYKDLGRLNDAIPLLAEAYHASARFPDLRWVGGPLLDASAKTGRSAEVAKLAPEYLAAVRRAWPKDSPPLEAALAWGGCAASSQSVRRCRTIPPRMSGHPREDPAWFVEPVLCTIDARRGTARPEEIYRSRTDAPRRVPGDEAARGDDPT